MSEPSNTESQETAEPPVEEHEYIVNATLTVAAWISVYAETPEAAMDYAELCTPNDFEIEMGMAEVEFNVTPAVELA